MKKIKFSKIFVLLIAVIMVLSAVPTGMLTASAATGKTYYVSVDGKDKSKGLSPDEPMSLLKANSTVLKGGDKMLFKRGDLFYGNFIPIVRSTTDKNRVEIDAYGEGPLPTLSYAKIVSDGWVDCGNGFYKFDFSKTDKYEGVKDRNGNVGFFRDKDGKYYGGLYANAEECKEKYDFYCEETTIYVKTDKDPYKELGTLKMAVSGNDGSLIRVDKGVNVSNIKMEYCGYGITWNSTAKADRRKFSKITGCVFDNLGGTNIHFGYGDGQVIRGGNGVEWFNAGSNTEITNCIFRNIFDVGFTCQGRDPSDWKNNLLKDNVFAFNTQAIEFWSTNTAGNAGIFNLDFTNNLCVNNGESWAIPWRPGAINTTDLLIYSYTSPVWDVSMEGNTFYHTYEGNNVAYYCHGNSVEKFFKSFKIDNNHLYFLNENSNVFQTDDQGPEQYRNLTPNFKDWQAMTGYDKNSTFMAIGDNLDKYAEFEKIAYTSDNYHEIVKAAVDAGLKVNAKYDEELAKKNVSSGNSSDSDSNSNASEELPITIIIIAIAAVVVVVIIVVIIIIVVTGKKSNNTVVAEVSDSKAVKETSETSEQDNNDAE
ncbi:MAG: right-handed parallel beta-helix repeat-containing protein [Ruminococcaceae bacterium]|nr:right-handed parallel beta-helix repeat-containing protein [Oscillospiraceae bacterium]